MDRSVNRKIGFLGGTFDPIHYGHLRLAEEAYFTFNLERVYFLPSKIPPHKLGRKITSPGIRIQIIRAAIEDNFNFDIETHDLDIDRPSYTVDTLRDLREKYSGDEIFFIIGMDSFKNLHTWKNFMELFPLANFVVARRPRHSTILFEKREEFFPPFDEKTIEEFEVDFKKRKLIHKKSGNSILFFDFTLLEISSSEIRKNVREGKSIKYLLPDAVIEIIEKNSLYME